MSVMEAARFRAMAETDRLVAANTLLPNVRARCLRSAEHLEQLADRAEKVLVGRPDRKL